MIVLTILKWIGIVLGWTLLGILALALLILLLVLFVPFRYSASISTGEIEGSKVAYGFGVTWILHAISVKKKVNSDITVVRILGIPVKKIGGATESSEDDDIFEYEDEDIFSEPEATDVKEAETVVQPEDPEKEVEARAAMGAENPETAKEWTVDGEKPLDGWSSMEEPAGEPAGETARGEKDEKKGPIERLISAIGDKIRGIKKKIRDSFRKIGFIFYKLSSIIDIVRDRAPRKTIKRLVKEVVRMIKYVGPKKIKGTVEFGTGDPSSTGLILGGVSLCKLAYQKDVSITPNFEEKCLVGNATVKGRVRVVYFLRMALRIWFDKDVHHLWRRYRRMKKDFRKKERALQS